MSLLKRGIISSGQLGSGEPVEYAVSTINLNNTTQYLELQGASSRLDVGTATIAVSGWGYYDGSNGIVIYNKQLSNGSFQRVEFILSDDGTGFSIQAFFAGSHGISVESNFPSLSVGWHHFVGYWDRTTNDETSFYFYVDGVEITNKTLIESTGDIKSQNIILGNSVAFGYREWLSNYRQSPVFVGVSIGQSLTQSDATYLYNNGNAICWPRVASKNSTLYNKLDELFDLGTFDGSTELQARTGHKNGWVLDNINSAPFTGTGLNVDCN